MPSLLLHPSWMGRLSDAGEPDADGLPLDIRSARALAAALAPDADPAELYALGLLQDAFRLLLRRYRRAHPAVFPGLEAYLRAALGEAAVDDLTATFGDACTPALGNRLWESLLILWATANNPAAAVFAPLCPVEALGGVGRVFARGVGRHGASLAG